MDEADVQMSDSGEEQVIARGRRGDCLNMRVC